MKVEFKLKRGRQYGKRVRYPYLVRKYVGEGNIGDILK